MSDEIVLDTECYPNFWSIGFYRPRDGKVIVFEHSKRKPLTQRDRDRIEAIIRGNRIITYNGINYDMSMIWMALKPGVTNEELKRANDTIIVGRMKPWHAKDVLGVEVPRERFYRKDGTTSDHLDHIDLIEPQPNAVASLKTLAGRQHAPKMQDLPYSPDTELTEEQMDVVLSYMGNDLKNTWIIRQALEEPLALRETLSFAYGINLMSKSDAQMGEAIIKKLVEDELGERVQKVETPAGTTFRFKAPDYIRFREGSELAELFERAKRHDFMVGDKGKVDLPQWLAEKPIAIGESAYQMGIGGLHSTEKNRAVHSDDDYVLIDFDVASYYPSLIINTGLYPRSCGPAFIAVARTMLADRLAAKKLWKAIDREPEDVRKARQRERDAAKAKEAGLKIALNSALFGKTGSSYSALYAPHLMITTTLTGQFALLMLIQRAEDMGISVVSANTDGVVLRVPRHMAGPVVEDRVTDGAVKDLVEQWERDTGFTMEATEYRSIYNSSVNDYIAITASGKVKWKGVVANPWRNEGQFKPDIRAQLTKNPQMPILANAVVDLIMEGKPVEETIRAGRDIRDFVTVVKVDGGATWNGEYLGKVVRYAWCKGGAEIRRVKGHYITGSEMIVGKTAGARPLMDLPDEFPDDIDFDRYIEAAHEILMNIGYTARPPKVRPIRLYKWSAVAWWALAA